MSLKDQILELKSKCYGCQECPLGGKLVDGLDPHVFASGFVKSKIFFIAEAPGADEVREKVPLIGRAGKFFEEKVLGVAGLTRNQVYLSNVVLCRPPNNRTPFPTEIDACRPHLNSQICLLRPKLLVVMGNVALDACCGMTGITKHRGKLIMSKKWSNGERVPVFPIFHPSYCLRGSGLKEINEDAERIGEFYNFLQNGGKIYVGDQNVRTNP